MNIESPSKQYCSQISTKAGEPLPATATRTEVFLLLEYPGAWGEKAFEESNLPPAVKEYLAAQLDAIPASRILLIRREGGQVEPLHFFVASISEGGEELYDFRLEAYADLLNLDLTAIASGEMDNLAQRRFAPLFLVCTHGRRDTCCARFGLPVYQALRQSLGDLVWQCSHVGGHRFAANLLFFPAGLAYGRLTPDSIERVADASLQGNVDLDHYRGRLSYPPAAQAAEYTLRRHTGVTALDAYRFLSVEETEPGRWRARFLERSTRRTHQLILLADRKNLQVYDSCRLDKPASVMEYTLVDYIVQDTAPRYI